MRQELEREHSSAVSLRTVERGVPSHRRELKALARARARFETPPGKQLQAHFGETRVRIGDESVRVCLFVGALGYSRRRYVAAFLNERQSSWSAGLEGAFTHFGDVLEEVLLDSQRANTARVQHGALADVTFNTDSPARADGGSPARALHPRAERSDTARRARNDALGFHYEIRSANRTSGG